MNRLIRSIPARQVLPRGSGAQNPQCAVEALTLVAPWPSAPIGTFRIFWDMLFDDVPLLFCQVHLCRNIHIRLLYKEYL